MTRNGDRMIQKHDGTAKAPRRALGSNVKTKPLATTGNKQTDRELAEIL